MMTVLAMGVAFLAGVYAEQKFDLYHGARGLYGRARKWANTRK